MSISGPNFVKLVDRDGDPLDDGNGKLNINATLEAASVNIGDVDVLTVPAPLNVTGGGTESSALRVTLANDSTGVLSIDDNGGSITVDNSALTELGYALYREDDASLSQHYGIPTFAIRRDNPSSGVGADGDFAALSVDYHGGLYTRELSNYILDTFAMIDVDNASEQLSATIGISTSCHEIFLQADESNTGYVMVGDEDVADNRGMKLNPGDTIILNIHDTRQPYLWGSAANQNVRCMIKYRNT